MFLNVEIIFVRPTFYFLFIEDVFVQKKVLVKSFTLFTEEQMECLTLYQIQTDYPQTEDSSLCNLKEIMFVYDDIT